MEKMRKLYTAAMLCTIAGLLVYGVGKFFFVLSFRSGRSLLAAALLKLPAVGLLGFGFVLLAVGTAFFIALTVEQRKQRDQEE